ncbi:MAG: hypothetical protein KGL35_03265, partial [Bradyrhizobium sp.]|nr:hypothetical protein [Bradyrhizobium sp.]
MSDHTDEHVAPEPAAPPAAPNGFADAFDAATSEWLATAISSSPISRTTEAWNHLVSALPALRSAVLARLS